MVGASGAISGVMGAYIVLYPKVRVHMLIFLGFFITTVVVPAYVMLGYWFLIQILGGLPTIGNEEGGVDSGRSGRIHCRRDPNSVLQGSCTRC